jgi:hypothetical protein
MERNARTQGYCVSSEELRSLRIGLRFSTGLCLALVATALALQSAAMVATLAGIGLVAGFSRRHPFDHLWNAAVRYAFRAPPLPTNPTRRRHAFKLATVWLAVVAGLFAAGASTAALVLGGALIAACSAVTILNLCIPSEALAWWERRHQAPEAVST